MNRAFCRGQFFSADFVVAVVAVCFGLGVLLHTGQLAMDDLSAYSMHQDNSAETIAASLAGSGQPISAAMRANTCWEYENGTGSSPDCSQVIAGCAANKSDVFAARRLVACGTNACLLTVKNCGRMLG
jgi:hypothetical protein